MESLPSPASSPSQTPTDSPSFTFGRKRQRSRSMESSASSSSPKRAISEGPNNVILPASEESLPVMDPSEEIDAYMREQGEEDGSKTQQATATPTFASTPPAEKQQLIKSLKSKKMETGETWFLVSHSWYKRWLKACSGEEDKEGAVTEEELGPVDNDSLANADGSLKSPPLNEGVDVEYVPEDAWKHFVSWYGAPVHSFPRRVITRSIFKETSLEVHPPHFRALILSRDPNQTEVTGDPPKLVTLSSLDSVSTLCKALAECFPEHAGLAYRAWKLERIELTGSIYPLSRIDLDTEPLVESSKTLEDSLLDEGDAFVVEFKWKDVWDVSFPHAREVIKVEAPAPLFASGSFFDNYPTTNRATSKKIGYNDGFQRALSGPSYRSSGYGSINIRSAKPIEPGTMGLGNMGNTCFMNSALQCLAHARELTDYFLSGVFEGELNPDNPLGMGGAIAEVFGALLHKIWSSTSPTTSFAPREFKQQLQKFAPQFSGYQQHDSQELVAFLLDGLHEDLNRVLKKPYVEKPDWEGGSDKELIALARTSWEGYMKRNDSVIVDLFQGQYQSTLVCPECEKVSITFDPFMYLTLPLPVKKKWSHLIHYVPWELTKIHAKIPVEINRDASFRDLKVLLGRWMEVDPDNLLTLEIFNHRFYKNLDDNLPCGDMLEGDLIVCFELPCHAQQSRNYKPKPEDPFVLPVFLHDTPNIRQTYSRSPSLFGYPSIAVVTQDQAKSIDGIYEAVVDRMQRWTINARDLYTWEFGSTEGDETISLRITPLPPADVVTEIKENGEVVTVEEPVPEEEGDITDEKGVLSVENDSSQDAIMVVEGGEPRKVGVKADMFDLKVQTGHKDYGTALAGYGPASQRFETWELRKEEGEVLLRASDALFCEFDENVKQFFFGKETVRWDYWESVVHPEFEESKKETAARKNKGISLQDCLEEFTKEEKLGEDDLWYCPRCKKHQQATKRFDLWKAPDLLVVHLKRFSNSRTMRDKIDAMVDFPIEGLDLGDMVGERKAAKQLLAEGVNVDELHLGDLDEPLVYDLFGVDEHMGGLGGGHYRAYALNHLNNNWYHFDDSYVTRAQAREAVNSNAYLLFYRRRTSNPLGGKSHEKIEQARLNSKEAVQTVPVQLPDPELQLPTPPEEPDNSRGSTHFESQLGKGLKTIGNPVRSMNGAFSPASTPPPVEEGDPPSFMDSQIDDLNSVDMDPLEISNNRYNFPDPSSELTPDSSFDAESEPWACLNTAPIYHSGLDSPMGSTRAGAGSPTGSLGSIGSSLQGDMEAEFSETTGTKEEIHSPIEQSTTAVDVVCEKEKEKID